MSYPESQRAADPLDHGRLRATLGETLAALVKDAPSAEETRARIRDRLGQCIPEELTSFESVAQWILSGTHPSPAEQGDAAPQYRLWEVDYDMIDPEIQRAAEQGNAEAQCRLGDMYYEGRYDAPRDEKKAVYWYRMAAEQGDADAQFSLGGMYANGQGVPRDDAEAVKWYQKAAEQGNPAAQYACNYAVVRFLPCAESGEFVNIGVVLSCPRTGYFNVRLEQQKFSRISNLFPEIRRKEIQRAIECFGKEMERVCVEVGRHSDAQEQLPRKQELSRHFFSEVVRPRESVVRCSEPRTAMAEKPEALLDALFERYVERLHAQEELGRNEDTEDEGEEEIQSYRTKL
jgi:hypothetical protein